MNHFDKCLGNLGNSQSDDIIRQAIVVLMGSLAKHMDKEDPKVPHPHATPTHINYSSIVIG